MERVMGPGNRKAEAGSGMGKKEVRGSCGKEQWRREQLRTKSTDNYFWGCCKGIHPSVC